MKVKFVVNLGSREAARAGLDYHDCVAEAVVDLPEAAAEALCKRGIAVAVDAPKSKAKPAPVKPEEEPLKDEPEVKADAKPEPKSKR